jgi:monoamine oxidase
MAKGRATRRLQHALRQAQLLDGPVSAPRLTRRHFLGTALLGSGLGLAPRLTLGRTGDPRIAIVGAGIAGLNAAWQLHRHGLHATVYEARGRVGGRMLSRIGLVEPGIVDDIGGSLVNTDHADLLALIKTFKLSLYDRRKDPERLGLPATAWLIDGRKLDEAEVAEDLRPLARRIIADARRVDEDFDRLAPRFDRLSVKAYLDELADLITVPYARRLIEAAVRSEYGAEPTQSSALQLLFLLPTVRGRDVELLAYSDEAFVVREGSGALPLRIARALGSQMRLSMPLVALRDEGKGYSLTFAPRGGGRHEVVQADIVVLALPFTTLRRVALDLQLPTLLRRCIEEVGLGRNEKLFAGYRPRVWHRPGGFAAELWTDHREFGLLWDDSQRQPDHPRGVLNFYFGGEQVDRLFDQSTQVAGRRCVEILEEALPGSARHATGNFARTNWTREPYTRGSYTNLTPGQYTRFADFRWIEAEDPDERVEVSFRNLFFAGEHTSDEYYGFMNGGAQTGRLAAESILRRLSS